MFEGMLSEEVKAEIHQAVSNVAKKKACLGITGVDVLAIMATTFKL